MEKYFDKGGNRLVYVNKDATSTYWDEHWDKTGIEKAYAKKPNMFDIVVRYTKKYVPSHGKVVDGGCGLGQNVYRLDQLGYESYGVDYAKKTVDIVNSKFPTLKIVFGDVMKMPFPDDFFDGYWSRGVIEHFYNGYFPILDEMKRVVCKGGYLFITFPHMSQLRKMKARKGYYPTWSGDKKLVKDFYQFALDEKKVVSDLKERGFKLVKIKHFSGTKGLKDEVDILQPFLQKVYDSKNIFGKGLNFSTSLMFSRLTSHSILLIFKKE